MLRQKPTQGLPKKLLKEATIHFYYIIGQSRFSDICMKMELKELNCSQSCISVNFFSKAQVLPCVYR